MPGNFAMSKKIKVMLHETYYLPVLAYETEM